MSSTALTLAYNFKSIHDYMDLFRIISQNDFKDLDLIDKCYRDSANKQIQREIDSHKEYISKFYYLEKEFTNEEYNNMINETMNDKTLSLNESEKIVKHIRKDQKMMNEFKEDLNILRRDLMLNINSKDSLIIDLTNHINEEIRNHQKDLSDWYFKSFVRKVSSLCPNDEDYESTISNVYRTNYSRKAMNIINNRFNELRKQLYNLIQRIESLEINNYIIIYSILAWEFSQIIFLAFKVFRDFINERIEYISDEGKMCDSRAVRAYTESIMSQLNQDLIELLPVLLTDNLNEYLNEAFNHINNDYEDIIWNNENEEVKREEVKPKTIESFKNIISNDWIEVNDLVSKYNNYFETKITAQSFCRMKSIKDNFIRNVSKEKGIKKTYYKIK